MNPWRWVPWSFDSSVVEKSEFSGSHVSLIMKKKVWRDITKTNKYTNIHYKNEIVSGHSIGTLKKLFDEKYQTKNLVTAMLVFFFDAVSVDFLIK